MSSTSAADQSPPSTAGGDGTHSKDLKAQRHRDKSRDAMRRCSPVQLALAFLLLLCCRRVLNWLCITQSASS